MYSFYGGKQGAPFVIVKSFNSVEEMVEEFKKGYEYTEVGFDEYVLINNISNVEENGSLYRRGYDFDEVINSKPTGGAVYIGKIIGPPGSASKLSLLSYQEVLNKIDNLEGGEEVLTKTGNFTLNEKDLIAGSDIDIENNVRTYVDDIAWASVCVREPDARDATTHVGFKIPYTVFDFSAELVDSQTEAGAERDDISNEHPFFESWKFKIPRGFRGDSIKNLRVITASNDDGVEAYNGQDDDRKNSRQIYICDFVKEVADGGANTEIVKKIYIGDYNEIKNTTISADGEMTIEYTHDDKKVVNKDNPIKYINKMDIDKTTQKVVVTYNTKETAIIGNPLNSIQSMVINPNNYHLLVYYSSSELRPKEGDINNVTYNGQSGWIDLGAIKEESGILIGFDLGGQYTIDGAIKELNSLYPNGLGSEEEAYFLKGKIVTASDANNNNKNFFAFDYNKLEWYYIGTFNEQSSIISVSADLSTAQKLVEGGVWLKITEIEV